jgi:3-methyl-2-oxobutanoate hydroxymethyltransferase
VVNALRLMKEGGADVVKMQGGREKAPIIRAIADAGVPVMSHVGMCPHFVHQYGGFKLQGRTAEEALRIIDDGIAIEEAGAVGFEIEAVPAPVAKAVDAAVDIFTFSIGAGPASCGQLLLAFDLLGVFDQFKPKFTKRYAQISEVAVAALKEFASEVRTGKFPDAEHSYAMKPEEVQRLEEALAQRSRRQ